MSRRPGKQHELRACFQCAKGKLKCVPDELNPNKCQRCARLHKDCTPQSQSGTSPPTQTRPARVEPYATSAAARATLSPRAATGWDRDRDFQNEATTRTRIYGRLEGTEPLDYRAYGEFARDDSPRHIPSTQSYTRSQVSLSSILDAEIRSPQDREADILVETYQQLLEYFPFVVVPYGHGSALRQNRPFLLKSISMVASYRNRKHQNSLGSEILEEISKRIIIGGEKTLDLLQGLLVYIAWYHCHAANRCHISMLVHIAVGLLADLGLDKPAHVNERSKLALDNVNPSYGFTFHNDSRTMEQRRVIVGCYYLSVLISTSFKRFYVLEYTNYMDESCEVLLTSKEHPLDVYLVQLVRLQRILARVAPSFPAEIGADTSVRAPFSLLIQGSERELRDFEHALPAEFRQHRTLALHKYAADMYLHEMALFAPACQQRLHPSFSRRLDMLFACLKPTKIYMEAFMEIPADHLHRIPHIFWVHMAFAIMISARLSLLDCNGWDLSYVREVLNFSEILGSILERFQEAAEIAKRDHYSYDGTHIMSRLSVQIRRVKQWYDNEVSADSGSSRPQEPREGRLRIGLDDTEMSFSGQVVDEGFWQEVMSIWELVQN